MFYLTKILLETSPTIPGFQLFLPKLIEFGEWLCQEVIKAVPHRHFIFSIPKILRNYFLYDRNLLSGLRRCAWEPLKLFSQEIVPVEDAVPGDVIAIQSFGDFLGFNPHLHVLSTDCYCYGQGMFMSWRHSGFNVFCGPRIQTADEEAKVISQSKDGKEEKIFDALEWLAAMCSHVPNKGEQMVIYYGYYRNVSRGKRQKENQDGLIPCNLELEENSKEYRKHWAKLIQKIYEVDPLTCPTRQGQMRIMSFIEDQEVIKKILKYLGLWLVKKKSSPRANAPPVPIYLDYSDSQTPSSEDYIHKDPDYSSEFSSIQSMFLSINQ